MAHSFLSGIVSDEYRNPSLSCVESLQVVCTTFFCRFSSLACWYSNSLFYNSPIPFYSLLFSVLSCNLIWLSPPDICNVPRQSRRRRIPSCTCELIPSDTHFGLWMAPRFPSAMTHPRTTPHVIPVYSVPVYSHCPNSNQAMPPCNLYCIYPGCVLS